MKNKYIFNTISFISAIYLIPLISCSNSEKEIKINEFIAESEIDYGSVDNIITEKKLDSTLWKDEVLAQVYEQSIVSLWDSIRIRKNKFKQIENFKFNKIAIPEFSSKTLIEKGIYKSIYKGNKKFIKFKNWLKNKKMGK